MGYIEGTGRDQNVIWSLEELVAEESMVRVIDKFIDLQDLEKLGFTRTTPAETGRRGYSPSSLCKLYLYGYQNALRSSRKLARNARRNVEVMWLLDGLTPDYKTISEFRRQNIRALQKLFREFVYLCRGWGLVGGELIAVDGTKIKASNNKKNNFSRKKLDARTSHLDEQIAEYMTEAEAGDSREDGNAETAPEGLKALLQRKELYEGYVAKLDETGENEVSVVDPDARLMGNNRSGVDVAYNVQSVVDGYFLQRTRRKVCCEVAMLFLAYNIKRALNILGFRGIMDRLESLSRRFYTGFGFLLQSFQYQPSFPHPKHFAAA